MVDIASDVERVERPTVERFVADYLVPQKPVVLTGAIDDWPALARWDEAYLRETVGRKRLRVEATSGTETPGYFGRASVPQMMDMAEYLALVMAEKRAPKLYMGGISVNGLLPELAGDIRMPAYVQGAKLPLPYFWLGAGGSNTQLHYDINNNFHALVRGHKEFILFPPDQSRLLYPTSVFSARRHFSRVHLEQPDEAAFPRLRRATGCRATLKRGDMLFLPSLWWHEVRTLEASIGINYWWGLNSYGNPFAYLYVRELPLIWWTQARAQLRWRTRRLFGGRK